jgi:hypothetical protein
MNVLVNISIDDNLDFAKTLARVRRKGLKVVQAMDQIGIISGQIDDRKLPDLRKMQGLDVEESRAIEVR